MNDRTAFFSQVDEETHPYLIVRGYQCYQLPPPRSMLLYQRRFQEAESLHLGLLYRCCVNVYLSNLIPGRICTYEVKGYVPVAERGFVKLEFCSFPAEKLLEYLPDWECEIVAFWKRLVRLPSLLEGVEVE